MKAVLTASVVFFAGVILLQFVPNADLVPDEVRAVLNGIDSIW